MADTPNADAPMSLPKVTPLHYRLICWACLGGVFLACFEQGQIFRGALLILVGMVSLLMSLRAAPGLMMFAFGASIVAEAWAMGAMRWSPTQFDPSDLLMPACMLGFVVSHARLMALTQQLFLHDPRPRPFDPPWKNVAGGGFEGPPSLPIRRGNETLHAEEIVWFIAGLFAASLAASFAWWILSQRWTFSGFSLRFFRLLLVAWILGGSMLFLGILFKLWQRRQMTPDEGRQLLQEELWVDTHRDQSRIIRWRVWARQRRKR